MAFPVSIFETNGKEYQCPLCNCIIKSCYSTKCGHLFCAECILSVFQMIPDTSDSDSDPSYPSYPMQLNTVECPKCTKVLKYEDIFPNHYVDQKINEEIVKCVHFMKGCCWTGIFHELKKKNGHLYHCGFATFSCKDCKQKIIRNEIVKHQNHECKAQFMMCPYHVYGCSFSSDLKSIEEHCQSNELQHLKLKFDYLEKQLFVPEIIILKGMNSNNQYMESNGRYYLSKNNNNNNNTITTLNESKIVYKRNGGYSLELDQIQQIWNLKSLYYGLIAYGIIDNNGQENSKFVQKCVWNVFLEPGNRQSLRVDPNVHITSIQLSDELLAKFDDFKEKEDTDYHEIHGEEHRMLDQEGNLAGEGVINNKKGDNNNNNNNQNNDNSNWYDRAFGSKRRRRNNNKNTAKKLEIVGFIALTGLTAYFLWKKFGRSHPGPPISVLQSKNSVGILMPTFGL